MTFNLEQEQERALSRLESASASLIRKARDIHAEMGYIIDEVSNGHHAPPWSNQAPFDLRAAYTKREESLHLCHVLQCSSEDITKASKGENP